MKNSILLTVIAALLVGCGKDKKTQESEAGPSKSSASQAKQAVTPAKDLSKAAGEGDLKTVQAHIAAKADLNQKDLTGSTPLISAATFGHVEICKALIKAGAEVGITNNDGTTPLMAAAFMCHPEVVKVLLSNGADKNARNNQGSTAVETAEAPWAAIKPIYEFINGILMVPAGKSFDYDRIQKTRPVIANILKGQTSKAPETLKEFIKGKRIYVDIPVDPPAQNPFAQFDADGTFQTGAFIDGTAVMGADADGKGNYSVSGLTLTMTDNGGGRDTVIFPKEIPTKGDKISFSKENGDKQSYTIVKVEIAPGSALPVPGKDLSKAAGEGDLKTVQAHLVAKANPDQKDLTGTAPLNWAATFGHVKVCEALIQAGANVNIKNGDGTTPLMSATFMCHPEVVKLLLGKGADKNARNNQGQTALEMAETPWVAIKPIYDIINGILMVPTGKSFDYDRIQKTRPVIANILKAHVGKASPGPAPAAGDLFAAVSSGDVVALTKLLAAGANVNAKEPAADSTPLMLAAMAGQPAAAKILIDKGADVKAKNTDGNTALHTAAFFCKPEMVALLIENGADVNAKNSDGETALGTISTPWGEAKGVYQLLGGMLQLKLDLEAIEVARPKIAEQLRKAGAK